MKIHAKTCLEVLEVRSMAGCVYSCERADWLAACRASISPVSQTYNKTLVALRTDMALVGKNIDQGIDTELTEPVLSYV